MGRMIRDSIRHVLLLLLATAAVAGSTWTFSAGRLALPGAWEERATVVALVTALECFVIFGAWYLGELMARVKTARSRREADELRAMYRDRVRWYVVILGISTVSNFYYRTHTLANLALSAFISLSLPAAIWFAAVKLRALPDDYAELARRASARALVRLVEQSGDILNANMRRIAQGRVLSEQQMAQTALALRTVGMFAPRAEQGALQDVVNQATGGAQVETDAQVWLSSADIAEQYRMPLRTAQVKVASMPGRRRGRNGRAWEVPASAVFAQLGVPGRSAGALPAPGRRRSSTQTDAAIAQQDIENARRFREQAQAAASEPQEVA